MSIFNWQRQGFRETESAAGCSKRSRMVKIMRNYHHFFILVIIVLLSAGLSAGNARFNDITADSINFITIDSYNSAGTQVSVTLNECAQVKRMLRFLKDMDIFTLTPSDTLFPMDREAWFYKISMDGTQCKVYLFENRAFISKSVYQIKPETLSEFRQLHKELIN